MSESLPIKYRPKEFDDVCSQGVIIKILKQQIATKSFKNAYLFSGPSGCGKTTLARIFANKINNGLGYPIEIDAASNNGVDSVRNIIEGVDQRSLESEYKIYIIDECHMLTTQSWNALLKTIEETPKYTIFIFCTTEYHKVPVTIQNRCQQYFLARVPDNLIVNRLTDICIKENYKFTSDGLFQICKLANGSMRQAISYLEKVKDYSDLISLDNVLSVLGDFGYDLYFKLVNAIIDKNDREIISLVDTLYSNGNDLVLFIDQFLVFLLDLTKYIIFNSFDVISIPKSYKDSIDYAVNVEENKKYYNHLVNKVLEIKQAIKGDSLIKTTVQIMLLQL